MTDIQSIGLSGGDRHFWARGYFVSTVGNANEEIIRKYIQEQEENDKLEDEKSKEPLLEVTSEDGTAGLRIWQNQRNTPEELKLTPHLR